MGEQAFGRATRLLEPAPTSPVTPPWFALGADHPAGTEHDQEHEMATVTTVPGIGFPAAPMTRRTPPRAATPRGRRASSATYRRRRIAAAVLASAVVVVAGQAGVALGGSPLAPERTPTSSSSEPSPSARSVEVVGPGDTLWSIASRAAPGEDPRPLVDAMSAARGGRALVPGETIRLPRSS